MTTRGVSAAHPECAEEPNDQGRHREDDRPFATRDGLRPSRYSEFVRALTRQRRPPIREDRRAPLDTASVAVDYFETEKPNADPNAPVIAVLAFTILMTPLLPGGSP